MITCCRFSPKIVKIVFLWFVSQQCYCILNPKRRLTEFCPEDIGYMCTVHILKELDRSCLTSFEPGKKSFDSLSTPKTPKIVFR
jgi:hypothetical protein